MATQVTYVGPTSTGVDIAVPGGSIRAPKGEPVEVPDDLAVSLLQQDTFQAAKAVTPVKKEQV